MANQNPLRPEGMNKILSDILNPKETQEQVNARINKEVQEMVRK